MNIHRIVVGSINPAKIDAVARVVERIWPQATVAGVQAQSGIREQPLSDEEAIAGATQRARHALELLPAGLAIGVEGNVVELPQGMFSTAWAVAIDENGVIGLGSSGRFLLPDSVVHAIRNGGELGPIMDRLVGGHNTKHKAGAVGIFTAGQMDRSTALEMAVLFALTRFLTPRFYED